MTKENRRLSNASFLRSEKDVKRLNRLMDQFQRAKILVIGDWILDEFVWGTVERISPEAPVPVVNVNRETFMPGGALNVANNVRTLGGRVFPCGIVGRDLRGRMLVKAIRREGISADGAIYDDKRPTTLKTRVIAHSQQVVRFDREDNRDLDAAQLKAVLVYAKRMIPASDVIVIEDYGKGLVVPELITQVLKYARLHQKPVVVDPKEIHFPYYRGVTVITPNRKEALSAYGPAQNGREPDLQEIGRRLAKRLSCEAVLITLGEEGMMLFERSGEATHIPTAAREVFDVSGAGDTVVATLGMALAVGATMRDAAVLANLAAGIAVGKLGTAAVTFEELRSCLSKQLKSERSVAFTHAGA